MRYFIGKTEMLFDSESSVDKNHLNPIKQDLKCLN